MDLGKFLIKAWSRCFLCLVSAQLSALRTDPDVWWCHCVSALHPAVDSGLHVQQVTVKIIPTSQIYVPPPVASVDFFSSVCSDFASRLTDNSLLLLLNEAVGQLAISSDSAVGGASIKLVLLLASQQEIRVHRCLLSFRGQCLGLSMKNYRRTFCVKRNTRAGMCHSYTFYIKSKYDNPGVSQVWTAYWTKTGEGKVLTRMWTNWSNSSSLTKARGVPLRSASAPYLSFLHSWVPVWSDHFGTRMFTIEFN